ncbi:hypothetical protein JW948_06895 [bacterium]|nr:hypothetical protein [bacterium]
MEKIWQERFNVHTYEVDALGKMSLPVLGSLLQETASRHANDLNWGYASLIQKNCIWVLTALKIEMTAYPEWDDTLMIETWPSGKNRLYYFRDFRIKNEQEQTLGIATTNWLIIDIDSRRPARPEITEPFDFTELGTVFPEPPRKWPVSEDITVIETVSVKFDDLDINNHVNNIRYFDWMLRSMEADFRKKHRLRSFEIHFLSEALENDRIQVALKQESGHFEHLLKQEDSGKSVAQARSSWELPAG